MRTADAAGGAARPLWRPFTANLAEWMPTATLWTPVADGGFGSRLMLLNEPGTAYGPLYLRDGLPVGTGHRWADDPRTVAITGRRPIVLGYGGDGWGGTGGALELAPAETDSTIAVADTRFFKGDHETYLRSVAFRTPRAPWRVRFEFEELLDQQGYDFRVPGDPRSFSASSLGESRFRSSRIMLRRALPDGATLDLAYGSVRKHKTGIPADSLMHEEIWSDDASLTWRDRTALGSVRASLFFTGADVERDGGRKVETLREGALLEIGDSGRRGRRLTMQFTGWRLDDDLDGVGDPADGVESIGDNGQTAAVILAAPLGLGGWNLDASAEYRWDSFAGARPGASLDLRRTVAGGLFDLRAEFGGRAPRSDELLTIDRRSAPDATYLLMPNRDLEWERSARVSCGYDRRMLGFDCGVSASYRDLADGIGWRREAPDSDSGRWQNDVEMTGWTASAHLARRMRFAGILRVETRLVRRGFDVAAGAPMGLPPERSATAAVFWERHMFHEDGIAEIGYRLETRGEMNDPWLPAAAGELSSMTRHDLLLGFRLLGADLGIELRNLTDERVQVSSGALCDGREFRWRLDWSFDR